MDIFVWQIVNIFTRCIFRCREEKDYNELKAREFVAFLIDECMVIFSLPEEITEDIEKAIVSICIRAMLFHSIAIHL